MLRFKQFIIETKASSGATIDARGRLSEHQFHQTLHAYSEGLRAHRKKQKKGAITTWESEHKAGLDAARAALKTHGNIQKQSSDEPLKNAASKIGEKETNQTLEDTHHGALTYLHDCHKTGSHITGGVKVLGDDVKGYKAGEHINPGSGEADPADVIAFSHEHSSRPHPALDKIKSPADKDKLLRYSKHAETNDHPQKDHYKEKAKAILEKHGVKDDHDKHISELGSGNYSSSDPSGRAGVSLKFSSKPGKTAIKISHHSAKFYVDGMKDGSKKDAAKKAVKDTANSTEIMNDNIRKHPVVGKYFPEGTQITGVHHKFFRYAHDELAGTKDETPSKGKKAMHEHLERLGHVSSVAKTKALKELASHHEDFSKLKSSFHENVLSTMHGALQETMADSSSKYKFLRHAAKLKDPRTQSAATKLVTIKRGKPGERAKASVHNLHKEVANLQRSLQRGGANHGNTFHVDRAGEGGISISQGKPGSARNERKTVMTFGGDISQGIAKTGTGPSIIARVHPDAISDGTKPHPDDKGQK